MIYKLRKRFVIIAMTSFSLTLICIIIAINLVNYAAVDYVARGKLNVLMEYEDELFTYRDWLPDIGQDEKRKEHRRGGIEAHYEMHYFAVLMDEQGKVLNVDARKMYSITQEQAVEIAQTIRSFGKSEGYYLEGKYLVQWVENGVLYVFLDCYNELESFRSFRTASITIGVLGLIVVFLILVLVSKRAIRPMVESYEKQKRFITDASHEIKTPLTILDANTEVMEMIYGENEWTQSNRNQVKRLAELTRKLVLLSRMEEGGAPMEMEEFSLSDALEEAVEPFRSVVQTQNKKLDLQIEPGITMVGNEAAIRQMISLLMDNAAKYALEQSAISLSLSKKGKHSVIRMSNQAEGLKPGRYDVLFERFYRPDSSRSTQTGGYGIGLSVVRSIVAAHKGKISAISEDGTALCFVIEL